MSKALQFYQFGPNKHDFYRCVKCHSIFTYEHERTRLFEMQKDNDEQMYVCCTSRRFSPTKPLVSFRPLLKSRLPIVEWLQPDVLLYTIKLVLARGIAPWAWRRAPWLIPYIEKLVSNRTTR